MSYEPTEWKAGDTVTSTKLNKIEQGIMNNVNSIVIDNMTYVTDYSSNNQEHPPEYFITERLATEIIADFKQGKNILLCIPHNQTHIYLKIVGYIESNESNPILSDIVWANYQTNGNMPYLGPQTGIDSDGYFFVELYTG